jgi:hypothetical protein
MVYGLEQQEYIINYTCSKCSSSWLPTTLWVILRRSWCMSLPLPRALC